MSDGFKCRINFKIQSASDLCTLRTSFKVSALFTNSAVLSSVYTLIILPEFRLCPPLSALQKRLVTLNRLVKLFLANHAPGDLRNFVLAVCKLRVQTIKKRNLTSIYRPNVLPHGPSWLKFQKAVIWCDVCRYFISVGRAINSALIRLQPTIECFSAKCLNLFSCSQHNSVREQLET
jgi:hypothetical protein